MKPCDQIVLQQVTFSYDGNPIIEDVSFTIPEKTFTSIVGPNAGGRRRC